LCLDIETARQDRMALRELGVYRPDLDVRLRLSGKIPDLVHPLDALTEGAALQADTTIADLGVEK
jgi:ATP-dependent DNA helicase RecQ